MCHSPCLARAVGALESVPWQYIPWAASRATAALLLRDLRAAKQPVEQSCRAGELQRSKLPARCGQGGAEGVRNGSDWEDWRFDSSET